MGWISTQKSRPVKRLVTDEMNKLRFIFALEDIDEVGGKHATDTSWHYSLIQNFIWWGLSPDGAGHGGGKYNLRSILGLNYVNGDMRNKKYDMNKVKEANEAYLDYSDNVLDKGITKAKAKSASADKEISVYQNDQTGAVYFGMYEMNDYSLYYSSACQQVNKYTNYSSYGKEESKGLMRGGILTGIVDAEVIVNGTTLSWEKGDFTFSYGKLGGEQGKQTGGYDYKLFPCPKSKFFIKIEQSVAKDKGIALDQNLTVSLKFTSIKVKAREIKRAAIVEYIQNGHKCQPKLYCGSQMTVQKWKSLVKSSITIDTPKSGADIKVYIQRVQGGDITPDGQGQTSEKYDKENGKVETIKEIDGIKMKASSSAASEEESGSRKSWSENQKENAPALAEHGDTITFKIIVTNTYSTKINLKKIKLQGLVKYHDEEITIKDGDRQIDKFTSGMDSYTIDLSSSPVSIAAKKSHTFTCIVKNVKPGDYKYLQATITDVRDTKNKKLKSSKKSADYYVCKKYNVTIDKFISAADEDNGDEEKEEVEKSKADSPGVSGIDEKDIMYDTSREDGTTGDDDSGKDDYDATDYTDKGVSSAIDKKIYVGSVTSETLKVSGQIYRKCSGSEYAYYKDGTYYCYQPMYYAMSPVSLKSDGGGWYFNETDVRGTFDERFLYLNMDSSTKTPIFSTTKTIGTETYRVIYTERPLTDLDEEGNPIIACYEKDGHYYVINDEPKIKYEDPERDDEYYREGEPGYLKEIFFGTDIKFDSIGNWYLVFEVEGDEDEIELDDSESYIYLKSDDAGPIHESGIVDKYFYPVYEEDGVEIACYWHSGLNEYFVGGKEEGEEGGSSYDLVKVQKDTKNNKWYIAETEETEDRSYVEINSSGNLALHLVSNAELEESGALDAIQSLGIRVNNASAINDIAGNEIIAYMRKW